MAETKLCTIVGMGPGVSAAVAERFAREGFSIAMIARNRERLESTAVEMNTRGIRAFPLVADAGDEAALRAAFAKLERNAGATSVLVYNATTRLQGLPSALRPEELVESFRTDVVGALVSAQAVLPAMRQAGEGTILFTGGGLALNPYPPYAGLAVAKAGIRSLAQSFARELAPLGIHVATVTICGFVKAGTFYDPDKIAEVYWELHQEAPGAFREEAVYQEL